MSSVLLLLLLLLLQRCEFTTLITTYSIFFWTIATGKKLHYHIFIRYKRGLTIPTLFYVLNPPTNIISTLIIQPIIKFNKLHYIQYFLNITKATSTASWSRQGTYIDRIGGHFFLISLLACPYKIPKAKSHCWHAHTHCLATCCSIHHSDFRESIHH